MKPASSGSTLLPAAALLVVSACGTDAVGVSACLEIQDARCRRAPACSIALEPPYSTSDTPVDACIRFYSVACLHGLATADPGQASVNACVAAIEDGGCGVVTDPPSSAACSWLAPTLTIVAPEDAAAQDAESSSDGSDADSAATVDAAQDATADAPQNAPGDP